MGADSNPAKIAQYLLRGYCLLNEYCPNGSNVPLVRSREGTLVCCCGDASCRYAEVPAGQAAAAAAPAPASAPAAPTPAVVAAAPAAAAAASFAPEPREANPAAPVFERQSFSAPEATPSSTANASAAAAAGGTIEVSLQGPELRFSCTRLAARRERGGKLLGGTFTLRVRLGVVADGNLPDLAGLKDSIAVECRRLADHVLLHNSDECQINRNSGRQVNVSRDDGTSYSFPALDCIFLQSPGTGPADLAAYFWDRAQMSVPAGTRWMEVSVADDSSGEAAFRKGLER